MVARESYGIKRDALPAAVCEKLGFSRITEEMRNIVLVVLERIIQNGLVKEAAGHITVV